MSDRDADGKLIAGHGVKSPGRPKGLTSSEVLRAMLTPHQDAVVAKLNDLAKLGDPAAMKLWFEKALPSKPAEHVNVPGFSEGVTLADKSAAVLDAVARGAISVEAGEKMQNMLRLHLAAVTSWEHEQRLAALEGQKVIVEYADVSTEDLI